MATTVGGSAQRWLAVGVLMMLLVRGATTAEPAVTAAALKAAFLLNFASFTEWSAVALPIGSLTICVLGDDAIADALDGAVAGRTIDGREVSVARVKADALSGCQVLYLTGLDSTHSQKIVDILRSTAILTVSDRDQFAEAGGIVGLFVERGKMRFAINIEAARRSGLRLSSKMLSLARIVNMPRVRS